MAEVITGHCLNMVLRSALVLSQKHLINDLVNHLGETYKVKVETMIIKATANCTMSEAGSKLI